MTADHQTPDAGGWFTAPDGGWGDNPVPGAVITVRFRFGLETKSASESFAWRYNDGDGDIIAYRLEAA